MRPNIASFLRRLRRDESGSVIVLVAISIVVLLGLTALAIDLGNLVYAQRRLQATTDMAALSGAAAWSFNASMVSTATAYSAATTDANVQSGLNVTMATGYPKMYCLTSTEISCPTTGPNSGANAEGGTGGNAVEVKQQATVPLIFAGWFGPKSVTLSATSLASAKGGALPPMNIMLVIDNTASMNSADPSGSCGGLTGANATRIACALAGAQTLLGELWPSQDQVGMMVFPGLNSVASDTTNGQASATNDVSCSSSVKSICDYANGSCSGFGGGTADIEIVPYSASPVYQLVTSTNSGGGSSNNFCSVSKGSCSGGSTALNTTTSPVVTATCQSGMTVGSTSCGTCAGEKVQGGEGTYYAGAINAAQAALVATNKTGICASQNCQNVIMLLSDGGAGNASTLASMNTSAVTPVGGTTLTFASAVPADVIPGTSVADNQTSPNDTTVIPPGTSVVSVNGNTVTLSGPVVAVATANTNAATPPASTTLRFASVPAAVQSASGVGLAVADQTNPSAIPAGTQVVSSTATTVTISNAVTGVTAASDTTSAATAAGSNILDFTSVPAAVKVGMGVADTTDSSAIPSGTTVTAVGSNTVTLSNNVGIIATDTTSGTTAKNSTTLTFTSSVPAGVTIGFAVTGPSAIPAGTTVTGVGSKTVSISKAVTAAFGSTTITFSGDSVAKGDTITFSSDVESGDTINFGAVNSGDAISFGQNNQCNEAITAAKNAAAAGTWVYSIAYGSSGNAQNSPNNVGCSDTETPPVNSCYTMSQIASDPSKFYSDPMGGSCTSPTNPSYTTVQTIFANIGLNLLYTQLLAPNTQ